MLDSFAVRCLITGLIAVGLNTRLCAAEAELLWVSSGSSHQILVSHYKEQQWSDPKSIYQSDNPLTSLAMATDLNGVKILVWSEVFKARSVLMKMQLNPKSNAWSSAKIFNNSGKENLAASMVVDSNNSVWVFWSANVGDLDDVYFVRRTEMGWSKPQKVNDENEVPDIRPQARINQDGMVEISWQAYSFAASDYVLNTRVLEVDKQAADRDSSQNELQQKAELTLGDISLPSFIDESLSSLLHFPANLHNQSVRVE